MFRVTLFLVASTVAMAGTENDFASLLQRLDKAANPFSPPVNSVDTSGLQGVYATLSNASGALYGENNTGSLMFEGMPWSTGTTRTIVAGGGRIPAVLVSLTPPAGDRPGSAVFRLGDNQQEVVIDLASAAIASPLPVEESLSGWIIGPGCIVTASSVPEGRLTVHLNGSDHAARVVAHSRLTGLTLIGLDQPDGADSMRSAEFTDSLTAIVLPVDGKPFRTNSDVLAKPCPSSLAGALVLTNEGSLLGVLGRTGIVPASDLLPAQTAPGSATGNPLRRLVQIKSAGAIPVLR
jgi:hypothetical protein